MKLAPYLLVVAFLGLLCASCDGAETGRHLFRDAGPDSFGPPLIEVYGAGCIDERDCEGSAPVCLADGPTGDSFCSLACDADPSCPSGGHCQAMPIGSYCVAD